MQDLGCKVPGAGFGVQGLRLGLICAVVETPSIPLDNPSYNPLFNYGSYHPSW